MFKDKHKQIQQRNGQIKVRNQALMLLMLLQNKLKIASQAEFFAPKQMKTIEPANRFSLRS
jgi:hypothetical protein